MFRVFLSFFLILPAFSQAPIRGFGNDQWKPQHEREEKAVAIPQRERMKIYMERMASKPHHAGSAGSRAVAEYALGLFKEWGFDAHIETFEALLPYPTVARARNDGAGALSRAAQRAGDSPRTRTPTIPTSFPRSTHIRRSGDVTAPLVYVNYGVPEDYEVLQRLGHRREGQDRHRAVRA